MSLEYPSDFDRENCNLKASQQALANTPRQVKASNWELKLCCDRVEESRLSHTRSREVKLRFRTKRRRRHNQASRTVRK